MCSLFFPNSICILLALVIIAVMHSVIYYVSCYLSIMHVGYFIPSSFLEEGTIITPTF